MTQEGGIQGSTELQSLSSDMPGSEHLLKRPESNNRQRHTAWTRCLSFRRPSTLPGSHVYRRHPVARFHPGLPPPALALRWMGLDRRDVVRSGALVEISERTNHVSSLPRSLSDASSIPAAFTIPISRNIQGCPSCLISIIHLLYE